MATTINQKPNLLSATNAPMVYVLVESDSAIYNGFKFRYVLKIEIDGTEQAVIRTFKNESNVGIFDISKIVKTFLETQSRNENSQDYSIHTLGVQETAKPFSHNNEQCVKVTVKAFYEKATSATTAPVLSSQQDTNSNYAIPATTPFTQTASGVGGLDYIIASPSSSNYPLSYFLNSTSAEDSHSFFTNSPTVQFVRGGNAVADNVDLLTVCFKQEGSGYITDGTDLDYMFVEYFNSAGVAIAGTAGGATWYAIPNTNTSGGASSSETTSVEESILYFGCGTKNLQSQATASVIDSEGATVGGTRARPNNHTDWAYYRIFGSINDTEAGRCTKYYYFYKYGSGASVDDRHQSCTRYDNMRLAWVNRLGGWDYMNFRGKSEESVDVTRNEMSGLIGTWDKPTFEYTNYDGERSILFTEAKRKLTINSDWLNEDEAVWLEELFTSNLIHLLDDDETILYPVILTDKQYTKKTSVNNKVKIQYTLKLEYANPIRTNS